MQVGYELLPISTEVENISIFTFLSFILSNISSQNFLFSSTLSGSFLFEELFISLTASENTSISFFGVPKKAYRGIFRCCK